MRPATRGRSTAGARSTSGSRSATRPPAPISLDQYELESVAVVLRVQSGDGRFGRGKSITCGSTGRTRSPLSVGPPCGGVRRPDQRCRAVRRRGVLRELGPLQAARRPPRHRHAAQSAWRAGGVRRLGRREELPAGLNWRSAASRATQVVALQRHLRRLALPLAIAAAVLACAPTASAARRAPCIPGTKKPVCHIWTGKVKAVDDGDTVNVRIKGSRGQSKIRLTGIQAMELHKYGKRAGRAGECTAVEATELLERTIRRGKSKAGSRRSSRAASPASARGCAARSRSRSAAVGSIRRRRSCARDWRCGSRTRPSGCGTVSTRSSPRRRRERESASGTPRAAAARRPR